MLYICTSSTIQTIHHHHHKNQQQRPGPSTLCRERRFMDTWLGKLRAGLAAEYGFYYRLPEATQWQCSGQDLDLSWKDVVRPIMQYFTERTPGTYIENKESR